MSHFLLLKLIAGKPDGWYMICEMILILMKIFTIYSKSIRFFKGEMNNHGKI
jgi:hypothetical protein